MALASGRSGRIPGPMPIRTGQRLAEFHRAAAPVRTARQGGRLSGPRRTRGDSARAASARGASWGGTRTGPPDRHPQGPIAGRYGDLAPVEEREPGTRRGPGWFVNRNPKIALNGKAVRALRGVLPGERDAASRDRGRPPPVRRARRRAGQDLRPLQHAGQPGRGAVATVAPTPGPSGHLSGFPRSRRGGHVRGPGPVPRQWPVPVPRLLRCRAGDGRRRRPGTGQPRGWPSG
jgi:hypothetical protein